MADDFTAIVVSRGNEPGLRNMLGCLRYQTRPPDQTVAVCSDQPLARLREDFPDVLFVDQAAAGDFGHAARALGLELAEREWVGWFNDDDDYRLDYVARMLDAGAEADAVYCDWNESVGCVFAMGSSTAGNFIVRTGVAQNVGWRGRDYAADGTFITAINQASRVVKVPVVLYWHNERVPTGIRLGDYHSVSGQSIPPEVDVSEPESNPKQKKPKPKAPGLTASATDTQPDPKLTPRERFLAWLQWGCDHEPEIHYEEARPIPLYRPRGFLPITTDCSGYVILCAHWAGDHDPSGHRFNGEGYTGDFLAKLPEIHARDAEPGDLIVYGTGTGHHVVAIVEVLDDSDFLCVSHGREQGPVKVLNSVEARSQPAPQTFLRFLPL